MDTEFIFVSKAVRIYILIALVIFYSVQMKDSCSLAIPGKREQNN